MTNTIADIETSDLILVTGSNTTENHPVLSTFIKRAVLKGKKLVVIDPRFVKLANNATRWLRPNPGEYWPEYTQRCSHAVATSAAPV